MIKLIKSIRSKKSKDTTQSVMEKIVFQDVEHEKIIKSTSIASIEEVNYSEMETILKKLRMELSEKYGYKPYIIFTDKALNEMLVKLPETTDELLDIQGLGEFKINLYGEELLDTIKKIKHFVIINSNQDRQTNKSDKTDFTFLDNYKMTIEEMNLFSSICKKRNDLAKDLKLRPYNIFSNKTALDLVIKKPTNHTELKNIYGLGGTRIKDYGEFILSTLHGVIVEANKISNENNSKPLEIIKMNDYQKLLNDWKTLICSNKFISRKEYTNFITKNDLLIRNVKTHVECDNLQLLEDKYKCSETNLKEFYNEIDQVVSFIKSRNDRYIQKTLKSEKQYLDNILKECDPRINLDIKQRMAVINDEDYSLILAGAGSGKTTTVAAKVKYLCDKEGVKPNEILVVSFTNKAVNELKERINQQLKIPVEISTFHKVGLNIVKMQQPDVKLKIATDGLMFNVIQEYLLKRVKEKPSDLKDLIMFFGYYIDMPTPEVDFDRLFAYKQAHDFSTLKEEIKKINEELINTNQKNNKTIRNEILRSMEEVQIANFLYLHNIDYIYEEPYPFHIEGSNKLYQPDFTIKYNNKTIYLEHFGITENGEHHLYTDEELTRYKKQMYNKVEHHKKHNTILITTFSKYNDDRTLLDHLKEELIKQGIKIVERNPEEVYQEIVKSKDNKYFNRFIILMMKFISNFKTNGYSEDDFDRLYKKTNNVRAKIFLKLCKPIYLYYQAVLSENEFTDFSDMINQSTKLLQSATKESIKANYKYIIVDEYQDISRQRFNLTKELARVTNAKIIAVGDDWQSIYAFAGSKITLFTKFKEEMGYADYLTIDYTYRNSQEVIDVAGHFVQKNESQLKKQLKSDKHINKPFVFYEYNDQFKKDEKRGIKGVTIEKTQKLEDVIGKIVQVEGENAEILLLVRYNFEIKNIERYTNLFYSNSSGEFKSQKYPKVALTILTVHKSKGLGFDNVIILNGSDEYFGFPSQIEIDPLLSLVIYDDKSYSYAEERRLFYVALTRTKNRVFILYPKSKPSTFIREMVDEYEDITLHGEIRSKITNKLKTKCPVCGYPLQFKNNKAYDLKLYMCTNEVEICGFMSNNLRGGPTSIQKCDKCKDGFLIIKPVRNENRVILGCTNYKSNKKGCNNFKEIDN